MRKQINVVSEAGANTNSKAYKATANVGELIEELQTTFEEAKFDMGTDESAQSIKKLQDISKSLKGIIKDIQATYYN